MILKNWSRAVEAMLGSVHSVMNRKYFYEKLPRMKKDIKSKKTYCLETLFKNVPVMKPVIVER